jgi:hypothetical protein
MPPTKRIATVVLALTAAAVLVLTAVACSDGGAASLASPSATASVSPLPQGGEPVTLDPAEFTLEIDNPYWPMEPGDRWVYRETDGKGGVQRVEVTVTAETKTIMGIEARVVHDVVTEDGQLVEDTLDWYAQDAQGNIWYLGEDTKEYENGRVKTTAGSWEAGVDGAQPGVLVPADPQPGMAYRQEYYAGEAEDAGEVLSTTEKVSVPYGSFEQVLMTKDSTPLDPTLVEQKFYAPGVGPVLALAISGGSDREELIRFEPGQ